MKHLGPVAGALLGLLFASPALAATGTCDVSPGDTGQSEMACVNAIAALGAGTVVADIFHDANGKTADQLIYGKLIDPWGGPGDPYANPVGCPQANNTCNGVLSGAEQFVPTVHCIDSSHDFNTVAGYVNNLDWKYSNPVRLLDSHGMQGAPYSACPNWGQQVGDGNKEGYKPWEGMVFDLGGPANKVALFSINDHGPQPCESVEYTVYLTNNPLSREMIDNPTSTGADPNKWNRAKLSKIYLEGWKTFGQAASAKVTIPDPNNAAQTITYTIEADSFTSVWSLPCGINFRYVGIIAGNDGKDLPACNFDSYDAEIDAVAGLTESGAGVCPDADKDGYVDCTCNGAPAICDCNDQDPGVHPGAPEPCDSPDVNCDGQPGGCAADRTCYQSVCLTSCTTGENNFCPPGAVCQNTPKGKLCVPQDCSADPNACPPGTVCSNKACVPACTGVVCPGEQVCKDGSCVDPCMGVQCSPPQICQNGACIPPCNCFTADVGCADQPGKVCDVGNTNVCVDPTCKGVMCTAGESCNPTSGMCEGFCNPSVVCPQLQKCEDGVGCVPLCTGVTCPTGFACDPMKGTCVDTACASITCFPPQVCMAGMCVTPDGGATGGAGGQGGSSNGGKGGATSASSSSGSGGEGGATGQSGKCGCLVPGDPVPATPASMLLVLAGLGGLMSRRRKR